MTTRDAPDPSATRLAALRAALDEGGIIASSPQEKLPGNLPPEAAGDDELVERLRARRSAGHVAAAYSAAHGHPLGVSDDGVRSRWGISAQVAVVACAALLLLAVGVTTVALWPRDVVENVGAPADVTSAPDPVLAAPADENAEGPAVGPTEPAAATDPTAGSDAAAAVAEVVVHVVGQVADPGLVALPSGARVADAVEAAGGAAGDADLTALNLARAVVDGEQVLVPAPGQEVPPVATTGSGEEAAPTVVALNTADAAALTSLPGVGEVIAARIIDWRTEHGPFTRIDELTEVSGIGPALLADVRDLVAL